MFDNALRILTIRGIDIRIDASWLVIAAVATWSFWGQFTMVHDHGGAAALVMAVAASLLLFSSVLAHELAHALEAQRRGVTVGGITLFMFGGVTESKFDVRRPVDEFSLTVVGPLTSFALGALFWGASALAAGSDLDRVAVVAGSLGWINLALGVFNLLPGAPLDGGRIVRSAAWKLTGDRQRSIRIAARAGRVLGGALIALGIAQVLLVEGGLFGGLWIALIGWFLTRGAAAELAQAEVAELLRGLPARSLATGGRPVDGAEPLDEVLDRWSVSDEAEAIPVSDHGRLVGVLPVDGGRYGDRHGPVSEAMVPLVDLPAVQADEPARHALEHVHERGVVVVLDHDEPLGFITAGRLAAVVERRSRVLRSPAGAR